MAKFFLTALRALALAAMLIGGPAWAAMSFNSATVNGASSDTVEPGAIISVQAWVSTNWSSRWYATSWQFGSGATTCADHANYQSPWNWAWQNYTETFSVTAPTAPGIYDLNLVAGSTNNCGNPTVSLTLSNAITVIAPPVVTAIDRAATSPNPALVNTTVSWNVVFSTPVTGVDSSDFALEQTGGAAGASIMGVTGSGANWTVTANTGNSSGTVGLKLVDDDSIKRATSPFIPLGGTGAGNGNFAGQTYTIITPPVVTSINRAATSPNPVLANTSVSWNVVFSTDVTGVDSGDFSLVQTGGAAGAIITSVTGSGANWTVTANTGTGSTGTVGLNLVDDDSIKRATAPFVPLGGTGTGNGNFTGQFYTLTATPPPSLQKTASSASGRVGDTVMFTVSASNSYAVALNNVTVTDVLPAGMGLTASVASSGTVAVAGQNVTWTIPTLAPQGSAQLTLVVSLTAPGTLTNTVSAPGAAPASASILVLDGAITHFRMDEAVGSWNGIAGEVIDSGGNNLSGRRFTTSTPTTTNTVLPSLIIASQYSTVIGNFCNAGNFDGNAVVQVPNSPKLGYTTQFSASAWIYPREYPSGTNPSDVYSILSNDVNYEFHLNSSGKLYWWWSNNSGNQSVSLTSAATIPRNQWTHVAITFNSAAGSGRQRIYINGVLDQNSNNWIGALQQNPCPFYIGGDNDTSMGCNPRPGRNFRGMIDEVKLYGSELTADQVLADMTLGRSCSTTYFDHVRIEHDGVGSVCAPKTVTVKACLDAACSLLYTGNVTVTLAPAGWVGGDTFTFSGGLTTRQLSLGTAGNVMLVGSGISPTPANAAARCFIGGNETCAMSFSAASCNFDAVEPGALPQTRLFTKLAGVPFNVDVLALQTATAINTSYNSKAVAVDLVDSSTAACPTGSGLNTAQNIEYTAANNGRRTVTFTYANAARNVRVRMRVGTATPACSTDNFAIRPQTFSSIASTNANGDSSGASSTATPAVKAGTVFALTANTGVAGYDGTPKLAPSPIEWTVTGTPGQVGTLTGTFGAASAATGNGATGNAFIYDEVGYFRFKTNGVIDDTFTAISNDQANGDCIVGSTSNTLAGGKYGCNFGNTAVSGYFGRFIPDHFDTAATPACAAGNFTYAGQPFPLTVTARNLTGATTQNYTGAFARAVSLTARDAADTADNPGPGALSPATSASIAAARFSTGAASATPAYAFSAAQTAPTTVRIRAGDGEASSLRSPAALTVEGQATVRSGRARLTNAYGSEQLDVPLAFRTEYWNGNSWAQNTADVCTGDTTLGAANAVGLSLVSAPVDLTCVIDNGNPGVSGVGCTAAGASAKRFRKGATPSLNFTGDFNLWLAAPGAGKLGAAQLTATVPLWLSPTPLQAMVEFGRYKSPLIYRREVY